MKTVHRLALVFLLAVLAACGSSSKPGGTALPASTTAPATTAPATTTATTTVPTTIPDPAVLESCSQVQEIADYNDVLFQLSETVRQHPDPAVGANSERISGLVKAAGAALETSAVHVRDNQFSQAAACIAQLVTAGQAPAGFGTMFEQALGAVERGCSQAGHPLHGVSALNLPF